MKKVAKESQLLTKTKYNKFFVVLLQHILVYCADSN